MASDLDVGPLLDLGKEGRGQSLRGLADAITAASDQNQVTYLDDGRRIAAIVPVDWAELIESRLGTGQLAHPGEAAPNEGQENRT